MIKTCCGQYIHSGWKLCRQSPLFWGVGFSKWLKVSLLKRDETSWHVENTFDKFSCWKLTTIKKRLIQLIFLVPRQTLSSISLSVEIVIQDNEKPITDEKQRGLLCLPAVDYQLSCICCCCLWFCRCMPSNGSRVKDPFPRKLHWNILTATLA